MDSLCIRWGKRVSVNQCHKFYGNIRGQGKEAPNKWELFIGCLKMFIRSSGEGNLLTERKDGPGSRGSFWGDTDLWYCCGHIDPYRRIKGISLQKSEFRLGNLPIRWRASYLCNQNQCLVSTLIVYQEQLWPKSISVTGWRSHFTHNSIIEALISQADVGYAGSRSLEFKYRLPIRDRTSS